MTKDEALDLALEALKQIYTAMPFPAGSRAITAIKQARSAPVQEPVAFNAGVPPLYSEMKDGETISVEYTTPPAAQRQWVGLMQGVRVEREYVVVSVHGGNRAARELCAALIQEMNA